MGASYLHGIEFIETTVGPLPITVVRSAVIGLVGTAPTWAAPLRPSWYTPPVGARQPGTVDAASAWQAATAYAIGATVVDSNGNVQQCTTAGTSGAAHPTWASALAATTADGVGTLVWTLIQSAWNDASAYFYPRWNFKAQYIVGDCIIDSNGNMQKCATAGVSGTAAEPTWSTTLGGSTASDGSCAWTLVQLAAVVAQVNALCLVNGRNDAAGFGPLIRGYTIPYALDAIQKQGAGQVVVVNVFKRNAHVHSISAEHHTFPATGAQVISLGHMGVSKVKLATTDDDPIYTIGVDFTLDHVHGTITRKAAAEWQASTAYDIGDRIVDSNGNIQTCTDAGTTLGTHPTWATSEGATTADGTGGTIMEWTLTVLTGMTVHVSYDYAEPTDGTNGVADADIIGGASAGVYTGICLLPMSFARWGFQPKILIAPSFSERQAVAAQLQVTAEQIRAIDLVDTLGGASPVGGGSAEPTTSKTAPSQTPVVADAIGYRGDTSKAFGLANTRTVLCYPKMLFTDNGADPAGNTIYNPTDGPFSPWVAGAMAAKDLEYGYWYSVSNTNIVGALGPDVPLFMSAFDANSDTNLLNAAGLLTCFAAYGTGLRAWGNRSSAYPAATTPDVFVCVRRTLDVLEDSIEYWALQYLDGPITNGMVTAVVQAVNAFIHTQIMRGALEPGSVCTYDPTENPAVELAAGHVTFHLNVMPPPPAERITFNVKIDINLLASVTGGTTT
jgi:uncharacterized protein